MPYLVERNIEAGCFLPLLLLGEATMGLAPLELLDVLPLLCFFSCSFHVGVVLDAALGVDLGLEDDA